MVAMYGPFSGVPLTSGPHVELPAPLAGPAGVGEGTMAVGDAELVGKPPGPEPLEPTTLPVGEEPAVDVGVASVPVVMDVAVLVAAPGTVDGVNVSDAVSGAGIVGATPGIVPPGETVPDACPVGAVEVSLGPVATFGEVGSVSAAVDTALELGTGEELDPVPGSLEDSPATVGAARPGPDEAALLADAVGDSVVSGSVSVNVVNVVRA
jgi:hypothetical protein